MSAWRLSALIHLHSKVSSFEFRCHSHHGSVLAATSSAELEELENYNELREAIIQHPELIYAHANAIRRMAGDEPLYIITGCIKSDSWAIAAFREAMPAPHDAMSLQNMTRDSDPRSKYIWTKRSTSEAYFGLSEEEGVKDQTLFLRGFKLDFSQAFRTRMKRLPRMPNSGSPGSEPFGPSDVNQGDSGEPKGGRGARFGGRDGGQSDSNGSGSSHSGGNMNTNSAGYQNQGSLPYLSTRQLPADDQSVRRGVTLESFPSSLQDVSYAVVFKLCFDAGGDVLNPSLRVVTHPTQSTNTSSTWFVTFNSSAHILSNLRYVIDWCRLRSLPR